MKKLLLLLLVAVSLNSKLAAQKNATQKWYNYSLGGKKSYFTKTHQITTTSFIESQVGSGDQWENQPVTVPVIEIVSENGVEKIITKYGDSSYYTITLKDITATQANVNLSSDAYKTIEEAKQHIAPDDGFSVWYTKAGFTKLEKMPVMPELKKQDAVMLSKYIVNIFKDIKSKMTKLSDEEKKNAGFAMALLLSTAPTKYAESKGYNGYKSLAVIDRGMKKFKTDKDVKKIIAEIDLKN